MRKAILIALGLVLTSSVLGATFREPLARAANPLTPVFVNNGPDDPVPVREQNVDADGNLKVHEQGTVDVNVANNELSFSAPPPNH